MKKLIFYILIVLAMLFFFGENTQAQTRQLGKEIVGAKLFSVDYSAQIPIGKLADRFGLNSNLGGHFLYKTNRNLLIGFAGHFMFGNRIKEDSLAINLYNSQGNILGSNGAPTSVQFFERGYTAMLKIGKLFPLNPENPNSGIMLLLGGGYMQHKIDIEDKDDLLPQFNDDYIAGYDRLTRGGVVSEFIGYLHLDRNKLINFFIGIEFTQGFTKSQRLIHFDTREMETDLRLDMLIGLRAGWILPLYNKTQSKDRYYTN